MRFSSTRVLTVSLISLLLPSAVDTVKVTHKGFFSDLFGGFWRSSKQATRDAVARDVEDVKDGIKDTGSALKNTGSSLLRHGRSTATGAARSFGRALKDGWSSIMSKGDDYLDDAAERSQGVFNKAASGAMNGLTSAMDKAATTLNRLEEQADRLSTVPSTIDRIHGRARAMRNDVRSAYDDYFFFPSERSKVHDFYGVDGDLW
ncbi:hypothetical protein FOZ63_020610 [Perkinsus olseni]|uniref:Uncharacterized protein n=1 Tax=Perkinsus olseni TaxID=32597 RepID=A0A7J6Q621_PEROL|nr:hypothetical protein FOZ63_020610 [Perkinsus olseni]KAF4740524.1 hypothetical protein FOZ62_020089 [Perkinsus olseni]